MAFENFRAQLNQRLGERVFLDAQRSLMTPVRMSGALLACYALSVVILLIPVAMIAIGIWAIAVHSALFFAILGGIFLIWVGVVLLPRPLKNEARTLRRSDLPQFYALLDEVAGALGTRAPDGVQFTFEMNAYVVNYGRFGRDRVLVLGVPMWLMASRQERIALVAHEMAHFANGDVARSGLVWAAWRTVLRWDYVWSIEDNLFRRDLLAMVMEVIQSLLRLPVRGAGHLLMLLSFHSSQRAEYLADGMAARVAGRDASVTLLRKFAVAPIAARDVVQLYPYSRDQNGRIFDVILKTIADVTEDEKQALEADAAQQKSRVDLSHPPTSYRIAFLQLLDGDATTIRADRFDFDQLAAELQTEVDRQGKRLMQRYEVS